MNERRVAVRRQRLKDRGNAPGFVKEHLALIASASLVLLSVIRVYYFAALNPDVALTVLSVANRTQVLVSTLLNAIVTIAPFMLLIAPLRQWMLAGNQTGAPFKDQLRTGIVWVPLAPILLSTLSAALIAGYLLGGVLLWIAALRKRRKQEDKAVASKKASPYKGEGTWVLTTILGTTLMLTLITPWQPLEKITLENADKPLIGYVVGEQAGKTLILDKLRKPVWTDSEKVLGREMCAKEESWMNSSLATLGLKLLNRPQGVGCS
ncbi:hypothetical protein QFZ70_000377 [Arthrobacter sp. V1I9]|uniref:hypothetical protein n=1 Tax=Arthrobacter sp. V1I9 TaxID=3042275 RepID=UPI002791BE50|nr:hypothetical protein [Arthrobacter sp. V1I9]MDQ0867904.1 hypothetical protein [Arthrobacter sp. V1I9]